MTDLFWDDFFKLAAVCLLVSGLLTVILRGWRHFRTTEAEAAAKIMREVKRVTDGRRIGIVTGVCSTREALIEWDETPADVQIVADKPDITDPRAKHAARLVKASIEDQAIGPLGRKITAAGKISGMSPNTRQKAVEYLIEQGLAYIFTNDGMETSETRTHRPLSDILALLPAVQADALDSAVTALPSKRKPDQAAA